MNNIDEILGKEISKIEQGQTYVTFYFTDGTEITIYSRGTEEHWIAID